MSIKFLVRISLILTLLLSLSACSTVRTLVDTVHQFLGGEDNLESPNELTDYEPEIEVNILWQHTVGIGYGQQAVKLLPTIKNGVIYAADRAGLIEALDITNGDLFWQKQTGLAFSGGVGLGHNSVYVGSSDGEVIAVDSSTGEIRWQAQVSSEVLTKPVIAYDKVFVRTVDGKITVLEEETGNIAWVYGRNVPPLSVRGIGVPVIVSDTVIAGYTNGKLLALSITNGKNIWESTIVFPRGRSEIERLVDLNTDPIALDDVIYISSYQNGLSGVLAVDGEVLWINKDISTHTGLGYDWRYLYLADSASDVWQLTQHSGASLWQQTDLHQRDLTAPVVYEDYVVLGDFEGYVHWLANDDGRLLGRVQVAGEPILATPIVNDDIIYIYASDGTLAALQAYAVGTKQ